MKTLNNIFKKMPDLMIMTIITCLLWIGDTLAGECTTNTSSTAGLKSAADYASQTGCFASMPMEVNYSTNISSAVGPRNGPNGNFHYGMDVGTTGGCKSNLPGYNNLKVPADGTVWKVCWDCANCGKGGGNYVVFEHELNPNVVAASERKSGSCKHYYTVFFHLSSKADGVAVGAKYQKDKVFAKVGGTNCKNGTFYKDLCQQPKGQGYNPHMHYEVHLCDWKKNAVNPLCPDNQALCDNTQPVTESAASTFFNNPAGSSNNSGTPENPYLSKKEDCSTKSGNAKTECEKRNKAIDEGGVYCKPTSESESKDKDKTCTVSKDANGKQISKEIQQYLAEASKKTNIPVIVLAALVQTESQFNPSARSGVGAQGMTQIMPATWKWYATPKNQTYEVCDKNGCRQVSGLGRCSGDVWKARDNILCGAEILKDNLKTYNNDLQKALTAYNTGAGNVNIAVKTCKASWQTCSTLAQEAKNYGPKNTTNQKALAANNNCSLSALGLGGDCESFAWNPGDSYGGTADDDSAALTKYISNYKCSLSQNFLDVQGCMFCPLFRVIFNASSQIAKTCHEKLAKSLIKLLAVGCAISLAWIIMQYVSDMTQKDPGILLNAIFRKIFLVVVIILLLKLDVTTFFNMFVTPVFNTGFKLAEMTISTSGIDLPDGAGTVDGSGLPAQMGIGMLKGIYAVQNRLQNMMALGTNAICIALHVKSYQGYPIFPHFGYLLTGVFMWIAAAIFMGIYPFLLIDAVLQFAIASSLFPAALAASAFEITKKYLNIFKIIHIYINAMFIFIFITLILFILLATIDDTLLPILEKAYNSKDGDYFSIDISGWIWYSKEFIKLIFFLFLGKAVLEDIPSFAEDFAKPLSMGESGAKNNLGIGKSVGATAAQGAKGVATAGAGIAWRAAKTTGGKALVGTAVAGSAAWAGIRSARHNYLMNRTQKKLDKANAEATAGGRGPVTSVTGRNFWGQKVTRSIIKNPDGTMALQSTRKSLIRRRDVSVLADENMSIKQKISKDGTTRESYKMDQSIARSLINKDGTINQKAMAKLTQNSSLPKEAVNKAILQQLMQQRMPNAGRKVGFKLGWPPVTVNRGASLEGGRGATGAFTSEKINSYVDDKGHEVFEVRRIGLDGNTSVFRMVKGESRALVEYERITKNGHSNKWSSDGIIQKRESGKYENYISDLNAPGNQPDAPSQVMINGAEVKVSSIGSDGTVTDKDGNFIGMVQANGNIIDKNGNTVGTGKAADLMFDQNGKALGKMKAATHDYVYIDVNKQQYNVKGEIRDANGEISALVSDDGKIISYTGKGVVGQASKEQMNYLGKAYSQVNQGQYTAKNVEFSNARPYKGARIFDDDGIIEDAWKDEEIMFDERDLDLYKKQMKKYGDVRNHYEFGR